MACPHASAPGVPGSIQVMVLAQYSLTSHAVRWAHWATCGGRCCACGCAPPALHNHVCNAVVLVTAAGFSARPRIVATFQAHQHTSSLYLRHVSVLANVVARTAVVCLDRRHARESVAERFQRRVRIEVAAVDAWRGGDAERQRRAIVSASDEATCVNEVMLRSLPSCQ